MNGQIVYLSHKNKDMPFQYTARQQLGRFEMDKLNCVLDEVHYEQVEYLKKQYQGVPNRIYDQDICFSSYDSNDKAIIVYFNEDREVRNEEWEIIEEYLKGSVNAEQLGPLLKTFYGESIAPESTIDDHKELKVDNGDVVVEEKFATKEEWQIYNKTLQKPKTEYDIKMDYLEDIDVHLYQMTKSTLSEPYTFACKNRKQVGDFPFFFAFLNHPSWRGQEDLNVFKQMWEWFEMPGKFDPNKITDTGIENGKPRIVEQGETKYAVFPDSGGKMYKKELNMVKRIIYDQFCGIGNNFTK